MLEKECISCRPPRCPNRLRHQTRCPTASIQPFSVLNRAFPSPVSQLAHQISAGTCLEECLAFYWNPLEVGTMDRGLF